MRTYLDFEKPIAELESKVAELRTLAAEQGSVSIQEELAKLEAKGIAPNPALDKRHLIRRVTFDLIGLPPTPEEVEAFVKDTDANAYEKLVDRLLASQHHGEKWGRHWLDLARFAESHGFEHDYDRPSAYHYRDFVIEALNQDMPYDRFLKWQIAGDELAPKDPLALKATGFLAAGVHSTQITKNEVEKHRYDELDDIVATIGTSMLGLTVGCARCHDHKFDPIPAADYYRMVSAFTTTVRSEIDLALDAEETRKARAEWLKVHTPLAEALAKFEAEQLPARLRDWEAKGGPASVKAPWLLPTIKSSQSAGGATFSPLADGSLLVSGKNAKFDTYTFTFETKNVNIVALRLEALSDPSLARGGPGRAANGNFALSDVKVSIASKLQPTKVSPVKITSAKATFEQKGLPVAATIDADAKSSWAVDPEFGKNHAAVFTFDKPIGEADGTIVTVTLQFQNNDGHSIGRPRLSLTTATDADLKASAVPESIPAILAFTADKRTPEQTATLLAWYRLRDADWAKLNQKVEEHRRSEPKAKTVKALISTEGLPPLRLHTQGDDYLPDTHFLRRGDPAQKDGVAPVGYLQVVSLAPDKHWLIQAPKDSKSSGKRTALANWITDVDNGAGRLVARVIVNRLWQYHMGRGLVATPSDFGTRGTQPTHPELLDYLATELIRNGWKLKSIHKLIVTSNVYLQTPDRDASKEQKDRDNLLWWRHPSQRLSAEIIRDSLLAVGNTLDTKQFGPGTLDESSKRRSIYFTMKRSKLIPFLQVFDAPDALSSMAERPQTTIAPQALLLLNHPQVRLYARNFATRVDPDGKTAPADAIKTAYGIALTRSPTDTERTEGIDFLKKQEESYTKAGKTDARARALADFCQVLMCLNEFIYVD